MFPRLHNLQDLLGKKSRFLFGARSTGKTTLIHQQIPEAKIFVFLDAETSRDLLKRPKDY